MERGVWHLWAWGGGSDETGQCGRFPGVGGACSPGYRGCCKEVGKLLETGVHRITETGSSVVEEGSRGREQTAGRSSSRCVFRLSVPGSLTTL